MEKKIRPIYLQLQGYLKQLPPVNGDYSTIETKETWGGYHATLKELGEITGDSYDNFKLEVKRGGGDGPTSGYQYINLNNFRFQLGGLISKIYGQYFLNEKNPLDGSPSTVISSVQNQSQSLEIQIVLEMTELITRKLFEYQDEGPEKSFLEKIKEGLKSGKSVTELINLILLTGKDLGLTIANMLSLLS